MPQGELRKWPPVSENRRRWCGEKLNIEVSSWKQNQTRAMFKLTWFPKLGHVLVLMSLWHLIHLSYFFRGYRETEPHEATVDVVWFVFAMPHHDASGMTRHDHENQPATMFLHLRFVDIRWKFQGLCSQQLKITTSPAPWKDLPHHSSAPVTWAWFPPPNPHELRCCRRCRPVASPAAGHILWPSWRSGPLPRRRNL